MSQAIHQHALCFKSVVPNHIIGREEGKIRKDDLRERIDEQMGKICADHLHLMELEFV